MRYWFNSYQRFMDELWMPFSFKKSICPELGAQLRTEFGFVGKRVRGVARQHDVFEPRLHRTNGLGVAEDVELARCYRIKHLLRHLGSRHLARADGLADHGLADELALGRLARSQLARAVAVAVVDARGHEVRAQHAGTDLVGHQRKILV